MLRGTLSTGARLRQSNTRLKHSVEILTERIDILQKENTELRLKLTDLGYQFEQMKIIVFGKKKRDKIILDEDDDIQPPQIRTKESYTRPIPKESEITETVHHHVSKSTHDIQRERVFYIEDIPLDTYKIVEKHIVYEVYTDGKWISGIPVPSKTVLLGTNVRMLVATLHVEQRLSYSQIQHLLELLFHIHISQGEIDVILSKEAEILHSTYDTLIEQIQQEPHQQIDETSWDINGERHFAWGMTGSSGSTVYMLGVSRGKGIAEKLYGSSTGVLISDDYNVYKKLAKEHQLCWAHLIRKFRDFASHPSFTDNTHESLVVQYQEIKLIFKELRECIQQPEPHIKQQYFEKKLTLLSVISATDPPPVQRIKKTLQTNILNYLTCLRFPSIPLTNNIAEQSLRHLVIKRRISFGSTSHRGADNLAVLLSVLKYLLKKYPGDYFKMYGELRV
jgi:hypothetical protein